MFRLLGLLAFIAFILALTNPSRDAFADFVEENVAEQIASEAVDMPGGGILGDLGGLAASRIARNVARRDNYVVASVYTLDLDGRTSEAKDWTFLGIGTQFIELHRPESFD